jgi:hypothetical protein
MDFSGLRDIASNPGTLLGAIGGFIAWQRLIANGHPGCSFLRFDLPDFILQCSTGEVAVPADGLILMVSGGIIVGAALYHLISRMIQKF